MGAGIGGFLGKPEIQGLRLLKISSENPADPAQPVQVFRCLLEAQAVVVLAPSLLAPVTRLRLTVDGFFWKAGQFVVGKVAVIPAYG